jgi:hypothetical protein
VRRRRAEGVTPATVGRLARALPGIEEGTSYGTPAWRVRGKLVARLHPNGEDLVIRVDLDQREVLMDANPSAFHVTDHYVGHEMMLIRLGAVSEEPLRELLEAAWRHGASKRQIAALAERST